MSAPAAPAAPLPGIGEVLGQKYRVERCIGRGGMGAVFQARHEVLDQLVAIKLLLPEVAANPAAVTRFLNEARAAARIRNEHVARVLDVDTLPNGSAYMVLEYLDGIDLASFLAAQGPLTPGDAASYLLQALEAIAQAHCLGIVHRDLKPANLFLAQRPDGTAAIKVLDFGISKTPGHVTGLTSTNSMLGSPSYMSPEQVRNSRHADPRSDLWSAGICLYQLLTGELPFKGENFGEVFAAILETEPAPPSRLNTALPPEVDEVVLRCLRRDPAERYASAAELAGALAPLAPEPERPRVERIRRLLAGGGLRSSQSIPVAAPITPPPPMPASELTTPPPREGARAEPAPVAPPEDPESSAEAPTVPAGEIVSPFARLDPPTDRHAGPPNLLEPPTDRYLSPLAPPGAAAARAVFEQECPPTARGIPAFAENEDEITIKGPTTTPAAPEAARPRGPVRWAIAVAALALALGLLGYRLWPDPTPVSQPVPAQGTPGR